MRKTLITLLFFAICNFSHAAVNVLGRMGIGFSNQFANNLPAISFKVQRSRSTALGAMIAVKSDDSDTNYGFGVKVFKNIYEEPNLRFFMAGLFAGLSDTINGKSENGFQVDGTFGSEFHLQGIESLGFSVEFGLSLNTLGSGTTIETIGDNFIKAAVHFYL